jgi:hypothetical protein
MSYGGRIRIGALATGVALGAGFLVGCGGGKDFADKARPAAPLYLNGAITSKGVDVSPNHVGAGPVVILVSNQTQAAHTLTLDGSSIAPVRTNVIGPTDTGTIQTTLAPGTYTVKAGSTKAVTKELPPAHLVIGKARPDSNGQVGLP